MFGVDTTCTRVLWWCVRVWMLMSVEVRRCEAVGCVEPSRSRGTYPHALHAAHRSERPKGSQRAHRFERLNATGTTERRYEVYKRDLIKSIVALNKNILYINSITILHFWTEPTNKGNLPTRTDRSVIIYTWRLTTRLTIIRMTN